MSFANIFKDIHGALNIESLIPLKTLCGTDDEYPTKSEFKKIISYLDIDENCIFFDPNSFLNKIIYWNEFNFYPLHGFSIEAMKALDTKNVFMNGINNLLRSKHKRIIPHFLYILIKS
jgi:hypothetical protein